MLFGFGKESIYKSLKNDQIFEFSNDESTLILSGYPGWKAYISSFKSSVWVEVVPKININKRLIYLPRSKQPVLAANKNGNQAELEKRKHQFFSTVPDEIIEIIKCYSDSHWEIVRAIRYVNDDLIRLISSNPALAYILVHIEKFNPSFRYYNDMELLKEMILKKQREILRISSFPGNDRIVKAVLKLNPVELSIKTLIKLKQILSDKSEISDRILNLLSFSDQINNNLLNLFTENKHLVPLLSNNIIFEMTESNDYRDNISIIKDIQADCSLYKLEFPDIKSIVDLSDIKEKLNQKIQTLKQFPEPPLKGNSYIQPLANEKELLSWSKRQDNCIRHYGHKVHSGKTYFYKVIIDSEEATLEIKRYKKGLKMGSLLGTNNKKVSKGLRLGVSNWFMNGKIG